MAAGLGVAGALLALAAVYIGNGWQDGFDYSGTSYLLRHLKRLARWLVPAAALAGMALYGYHMGTHPNKNPGRILLGAPRAFALFPLFGMLILLSMLYVLIKKGAVAVGSWTWRKFKRLPRPPDSRGESFETGMMGGTAGVALWFLLCPFAIAKLKPDEGKLPTMPGRFLRGRMLLNFPWVLLMVVFLTHFVSEDTGDRVDPYWLAVGASYWLTDYLIVLGMIAPELARRDAAEMLK